MLRISGQQTRDFNQTPISLFRFSALTFNGHKIHYSKEWCQKVEGHRDLVVHGPLNLINMLDFWRDTEAAGDDPAPKIISYRATAPLYAGETYRVVLSRDSVGKTNQVIYRADGKVAMRGDIESF
jgi:hydroxyacyl-ACP dehydratase HTD2-like protein with hotdog domain